MLSILDKDKKKARFCTIEYERMQAEINDTLSEKFLSLKPATCTVSDLPKVLWLDYDNLG